LASTEKRGQGGLSVRAVGAMLQTADVPAVIIHDACRTSVAPKAVLQVNGGVEPKAAPPPLKILDANGKPVALPAIPEEGGVASVRPSERWLKRDSQVSTAKEPAPQLGERTPTILYSTRSGEVAAADASLVEQLAVAINDKNKRLTDFVAWKYRGRVGRLDAL